jgi:hypothetical protein
MSSKPIPFLWVSAAKLRVNACCGLIVLHVCLLAWSAYVHSPALDEWFHLPSGIATWQSGRYDLYRINPPLVRMTAALPVLPYVEADPWEIPRLSSKLRPELIAGDQFLLRYGNHVIWWTTLGRWACIPFSVIGAVACLRWATELYGKNAGVLATALWCFCPNVLAHGSLMTPDMGATGLGVMASYLLWKWLREPSWIRAASAGGLLGLVLLTKLTWIILLLLWPILWLAWVAFTHAGWRLRILTASQLVAIVLLGIFILNAGYNFTGSMHRLRDYTFHSHALAGTHTASQVLGNSIDSSNRFRDTLLGFLPIPLPEDYVLGIDQQKSDFEDGWWSYLRGKWSLHGWWYYYLYAIMIKAPLGTIMLVCMALGLSVAFRAYRASLQDELTLLMPGIAILIFVSAESGFSHHLRYVLPAFPYFFIFASKLGRAFEVGQLGVRNTMLALLAWTIVSSLAVFPHFESYFNGCVGGPKYGHLHLDNSNTDWGQDVSFLMQWHDEHREARPLYVAFDGVPNPAFTGIEFEGPPLDPRSDKARMNQPREQLGPRPGWYALSVNALHTRTHDFDYFLECFEPIDRVGYAYVIYHVTEDQAKMARHKLGLSTSVK